MENRYTKKGYVRKIIVVLAMLMIFNFIYPYIPVYAEDTTIA